MSYLRRCWLLAPVFLLIGVMIAVFWEYTLERNCVDRFVRRYYMREFD